MHRAALLVEAHAAEVDKVFLVLNSALGSGMSWDDIEEMVKNEKSGGAVCFGLFLIVSFAE